MGVHFDPSRELLFKVLREKKGFGKSEGSKTVDNYHSMIKFFVLDVLLGQKERYRFTKSSG
jgi:hypothetical protein